MAILFWAILPPLLALAYYRHRLRASISLRPLLVGFLLGGLAGLVALGLQWIVEWVGNFFPLWRIGTRSLVGAAVRQLIAIGPIEEGAKFGAVLLLLGFRPLQPFQNVYTTLVNSASPLNPPILGDFNACNSYSPQFWGARGATLLYTTAIACGFTAEENLIYFWNDTAPIFDRTFGVAVHTWFSAPWGYALGYVLSYPSQSVFSGINSNWRSLLLALLSAIAYHALVNILAIAGGYDPPVQWLNYSLFPFFLWMAWRTENFVKRSRGKSPLVVISGSTRTERNWQRGLVLFMVMIGGNAIYSWFLLGRTVSALSLLQLLETPALQYFFLSRFTLSTIPAAIAWSIYRYLRKRSDRSQIS